LGVSTWKPFRLSELFDIRKGSRVTKANMKPRLTPFISAIDSNNGVRQHVSLSPAHPGNLISINYNGNGVAEAFYQPEPFFVSDDVNVLYPRFALNAIFALFLCTNIRREKCRFNYGRKWNLERAKESEIRLPIDIKGHLDLNWMRRYILSRKFSSQLYEDERDVAIARQRLAEIKVHPNALVQNGDLEERLARIDNARTKP
jgi:hypothetical protein